jgi:phosphomannomutase
VPKTIHQIIQQSGIKFGTSGARGLVCDFTPEVCTAFTHSFLDAMKKSFEFKKIAIAMDNRPSSPDMAASICGTIKTLGFEVDFYGVIPTPALALQSMKNKIPSREYNLQDLVNDMMESDLKLMTKDQYLKDGGYQIMSYFE